MLRSTATALVFASAMWILVELAGAPVGSSARAAFAVALGSVAATVAFGRASSLPIAIGALSPLVFALLDRRAPGLAAAGLCFAWLLPRLVLCETRSELVRGAATSAAAAGVAGLVFASYVDALGIVRAASCLFAGSCLSLATLVPVDTGVGWALRSAATVIEPPTRAVLERAARAHRQSKGRAPEPKRWRDLVRMADQRAVLARSKRGSAADAETELDRRIAQLVDELVPRSPPTPTVS